MRNQAKRKGLGNALTVQLLGSIDDIVSPEDNIDLVAGRDFIYLDVAYSGHGNIINLNEKTALVTTDSSAHSNLSQTPQTVGQLRASIIHDALFQERQELTEQSILPSDLEFKQQRADVTDVIFVIHGIRDLGFWTHKVARRILTSARNSGDNQIILATETSSYGYFPILSFVLPSKRRAKVEWLMDQYAQALALYPNAEFSFVGHSNGTYLLANALRDYPSCRFKHAVLAGSVIHTQYNWQSMIEKGKIKKVLNYVATADWVVAFFPRAFQLMKLQDLGSAGHDGFAQAKNDEQIMQIKYVKGGHGAALHESNWQAISEFILTGDIQMPPQQIKSSRQSLWVKIPGLIAPLVILTIIALCLIICFSLWHLDIDEWLRTLLIMLFLSLIWKVVTRL